MVLVNDILNFEITWLCQFRLLNLFVFSIDLILISFSPYYDVTYLPYYFNYRSRFIC
jgi:hypothetical protein